MPKPGNLLANRLVIRFVMARLNAATHLLRNRIRRIGASRIARSDMTHVAIIGCRRPHCSMAYSVLACLRMGMSGQRSPLLRGYTTAADTRATDFAGASAIKIMPMTTKLPFPPCCAGLLPPSFNVHTHHDEP